MQAEYEAYLLAHGAGQSAHSGRTLWDHLLGVQRILQANCADEYVCVAGLFHSVYGTQAFRKVTVDQSRRPEVQKLIGEKAESLVMAFNELPRPRLFEATLRESNAAGNRTTCVMPTPAWLIAQVTAYNKQQFFKDLLALECANLAEQRTLHEFPLLARHAQVIGMLDQKGFLV